MKWILKLCLVCSLSLFCLGNNFAQETVKERIGLFSGYGGQSFLDVPYGYHTYFVFGQYNRLLTSTDNWTFDFIVQPLFGRTDFRSRDEREKEGDGFEAGINFGLQLWKPIIDDVLYIYGITAVGPHYITDAPKRQKAGFIFSNNIFIGINYYMGDNITLDVRGGFRHMSNAGLKSPNGGLNNVVVSAGIFPRF